MDYHGWTIERNPKPIPTTDHDWDAFLDDGTTITGPSEQSLKNEIDDMCAEMDAEIQGEDYRKGRKDCRDGLPHSTARSIEYTRGYGEQYAIEQQRRA